MLADRDALVTTWTVAHILGRIEDQITRAFHVDWSPVGALVVGMAIVGVGAILYAGITFDITRSKYFVRHPENPGPWKVDVGG